MTNLGFAPTQALRRLARAHPATAPALAAPAVMLPGTLVAYSGSSVKDHGNWILGGPCDCGCGGLQLWRRQLDGLHRLVHVSAGSVAKWTRP